MRRNALLALCGLWILAASLAAAATPRVLHYEGRLTDAAGVPLAGPVTLTFTFHGAPAGGAALAGFTDTDEVTPDAQGVVSTWVGDDPGPDSGIGRGLAEYRRQWPKPCAAQADRLGSLRHAR